jgi:photosystem II stability/assembly factor-like uncharacterized protein
MRKLVFLLAVLVIAVLIAGGLAGLGIMRLSRQTALEPERAGSEQDGELVALAYDPANNSFLKATAQGIYRSDVLSLSKGADGQDWQRLVGTDQLGAGQLKQLVINPDHPTVVYAGGPGLGVLRSDDGGKTWRDVTADLPGKDVDNLAIHSFQRDTLYAWIKGQALYRTDDGGNRWRKVDQGPENPEVLALVHSTLDGSMNTGWLYAGTPDGAYLSMD